MQRIPTLTTTWTKAEVPTTPLFEPHRRNAVAFHSSEWDVGTVMVFIQEFADSRTLIPDTTAPGKNLHTVRLTLEEA